MSGITPRGRFPIEPVWPQGGMVSKPINDRNYDVQQFTGYSTSTVPGGNWDRGQFYRFAQPQLRPTREPTMYDPTKPDTWPTAYRR